MADDFSELYELAADLSQAPAKASPLIRKAVEVTARYIRDDWRQGAAVGAGEGFSASYAGSMFYDMKFEGDAIGAEIGPELGRPGGSAGFLEEAPGDVRVSPQHAGRNAVRANEDDFVRGLEIAIFDAIAKG